MQLLLYFCRNDYKSSSIYVMLLTLLAERRNLVVAEFAELDVVATARFLPSDGTVLFRGRFNIC